MIIILYIIFYFIALVVIIFGMKNKYYKKIRFIFWFLMIIISFNIIKELNHSNMIKDSDEIFNMKPDNIDSIKLSHSIFQGTVNFTNKIYLIKNNKHVQELCNLINPELKLKNIEI